MLGTRGNPAAHSGFEICVENLGAFPGEIYSEAEPGPGQAVR